MNIDSACQRLSTISFRKNLLRIYSAEAQERAGHIKAERKVYWPLKGRPPDEFEDCSRSLEIGSQNRLTLRSSSAPYVADE
jgi:hypothetical protein